MTMNGNPIRKRGERNVFCSFYGTCLDFAIERDWGYWNCTVCPHKSNRDDIPEMPMHINHSVAYYEVHIESSASL